MATTAPVAIVGAGPVGMAAALTLATRAIRSVVFDNKDTFNDGSRAICVPVQFPDSGADRGGCAIS